jgi:hypothetical protein
MAVPESLASEVKDRGAATTATPRGILIKKPSVPSLDMATSLSPAPGPIVAGQGFSADDLEMQDWEIAPGHISRRAGPVDRKSALEAPLEHRVDIS